MLKQWLKNEKTREEIASCKRISYLLLLKGVKI